MNYVIYWIGFALFSVKWNINNSIAKLELGHLFFRSRKQNETGFIIYF